MSEYTFLLAIAGVLLAGAMSPGPSFLVVAKNALGQTRAHGVACAVGTGLGVAIFAVLAGFGVTTLIETVPSAFIIFKFVGGSYLLFLAWRIWRSAKLPLNTQDRDVLQTSLSKAFLEGLITQTSNPKTALVIAGIFAAFVPAKPPENTTLLVAIIAFAIDFSWYAVVAMSLSTKKTRQVYEHAKSGFDHAAAIFLGIVGLRLLTLSIEV